VTTDRLIMAHLPYVRRFASRNVEEGEDLEDVFQIAFMGLQRSTRRFDPERGHRFLIYATYWMRQALTRWRSDERAIIRIPVHRHSDLSALDEAVDRLGQSLDRTPASTELAADLEWSSEQVERLLKIPRVLVDMDDLAPDWISVPAVQEDFVQMTEMRRVIAELLKELPERDIDIVRKRFGFDASGEMTLEEIGSLYGVTRERIRQIESRALRQLSNPARVRRLRALAR
jgi:RNA polymerase primary sigma factor